MEANRRDGEHDYFWRQNFTIAGLNPLLRGFWSNNFLVLEGPEKSIIAGDL